MTLQLRVGGVYKNRKGERVEIDFFGKYDFPFSYGDTNCLYYMRNGSRYLRGEDPSDLIAEWDDKPTLGAQMPGYLSWEKEDRIAELEAENRRLIADVSEDGEFIASLEEEFAAAQQRIKALEALLPKPKVESKWYTLSRETSLGWVEPPQRQGLKPGVIIVRHDTITSAEGEVSYQCEVES